MLINLNAHPNTEQGKNFENSLGLRSRPQKMNKNILGPSEYFLRLMVLSRVEVNRGMSVMLDLLLWSRLWTGGYPGPLVKPSPLLYYTLLYYIHWSDPPSPPILLAIPYLLHQLIATAIATPIVLTLSIPKELSFCVCIFYRCVFLSFELCLCSSLFILFY